MVANWDELGLFKGFIPGKNAKGKEKEPIQPYTKAENHFTFEQCEPHANILGILDNQTILMDADEQLHSDNLLHIIEGEQLPCLVTSRDGGRGIHALFINQGVITSSTHIMLACGVVVDIKLGCKNGLECLKFQGVERNEIYNLQPYQAMPKYMMPLKGCSIDFTNLGEGDGRNDALYRYILVLQNNGFTVDEVKDCIGIINRYILKVPVSDDELSVILRDEAFKKQSFFKGSKFLHDKFAEHIKRQHHVKTINGQLHIFKDGIYVPGYKAIEKAMASEISSLTDAKRKEVIKQLILICDDDTTPSPAHLIAFRNGVYDLNTDELLSFDADMVITNRIPWDFNRNAKSDLVDIVLDMVSCDDADIRALLEECCGSCFYRSNVLGKAFILTGEKNNGKSTYLDMLKNLLGKDNVSALDMKNLDDRFSTILLYGKLANIGDDIADDYKSDVSTFKKIVTGNSVEAEQKGQPKFDFEPYVKLIFSANTIFHMKDNTGAAQKRLVIIPFNAELTKDTMGDKFDPHIKYKLQGQECMEYLIQLGIQGLKRVLENKGYTRSAKVQRKMNEYEKENNPVLSFVEDVGIDSIENEPTKDVYRLYGVFCAENGFKPLSNITFSKQLIKATGLQSKVQKIQGQTVTTWVKVTEQPWLQ